MHIDQLRRMIVEVGDRFALDRFYVIGSAAVLAAIPDPPPGALTATRDIDIVPPNDDEQVADQISFVLGEASEFDIEHGYYAEGVTSLTPTYAPQGWQGRANPLKVGQYTALCMEPHDLVMSKIGAGREKDLEFARAAIKLDLVNQEQLQNLLAGMSVDDGLRAIFERRIAALAK